METGNSAKEAAANAAAELINDGMLVGLGTGSTAAFFIDRLIQRCKEGLKIQVVATSARSQDQAVKGGIPLADINQLTSLDITVDGADEIDSNRSMIKGGGGALLREKIVASMSHEVVIVVDQSKVVKKLGAFPLPIEIVPFAWKGIVAKIEIAGYHGKLRVGKNNEPYVTDNGNYIYDINFPNLIADPELTDEVLRGIPGVVETGLFLNIADKVIVEYPDGRVEIRS